MIPGRLSKIMKSLIIIIVLFPFLVSYYSYGQYLPVEQIIYFQRRIDNPVKVEVFCQDDKYQFYATNRSFFPYTLNIHFQELKNLTPEFLNRDFIVLPGRIRLFSLSVKEKETAHSYRYNFTYKIGIKARQVDHSYPYLIPVGAGKTIELVICNYDQPSYCMDFFKLNAGDTIFAMRKGYIAAVPNMYHDADRISAKESLEIIHKDETIMIYENIDPGKVFVKPGDTVIPGQPIGLINFNGVLEVYLYVLDKEWVLRRLEINYYLGDNRIETFSSNMKEVIIEYPKKIITKELTNRELKKTGIQ